HRGWRAGRARSPRGATAEARRLFSSGDGANSHRQDAGGRLARQRQRGAIMNEWTPILDGDRIQEAWEVIESIAAELAERKSNEQLGAFALAERALFFRYLELARPGRGSEAIAERFVDAAIDEVAQTPLPPTLYGGFVGVSWILEHIAKSGSKILDEDPNQAIDSILAALLSRNQWRGDYDLIRGIVGVGVYASERETPDARACLDAVVGHLAATAEPV